MTLAEDGNWKPKIMFFPPPSWRLANPYAILSRSYAVYKMIWNFGLSASKIGFAVTNADVL